MEKNLLLYPMGILKNDIDEYFQKRKSGEISFRKVDSQEKEKIYKYFGSLSKTDKSDEISGSDELINT